jgi:hypothetical protein
MDSQNFPNQQLPQQPSPVGAYPEQPPANQQAQTTVDPGGYDSQSYQTEPVQETQQPQTYAEQPQEAQQPPQAEHQQQYAPDPQDPGLFPGVAKPQAEEILFEWQSASRPYKARTRQYFTTISLIAALIALILAFAGQLLVVGVIAAVIFVVYVLNSTPPGIITHKITTYGIRVEENLYYWEEMGRFWFTEKFGEPLLHIETTRFPNRLVLLLGTIKKEDMAVVLSEVLLNQEPPPTAYEKAAKWLQEKLPIDLES